MNNGLLLLIAYLIGSLPIGLFVGKMVKGIDIRDFGSGNIGASNVWRILGPVWGILVFLLDVTKGLLPTIIAHRSPNAPIWIPIATGVAAILGHNFSPFLRFKGGKGVATSLGVAFGLSWQGALIGFAVWGLLLLLTRYISLASMIATTIGAICIWQFNGHHWPYAVFAFLATFFVIFTHRANIQRLRDGTERRVSFGKKKITDTTTPTPQVPSR
jgi:glycerol-3-phosphate acyltransferase PlsY